MVADLAMAVAVVGRASAKPSAYQQLEDRTYTDLVLQLPIPSRRLGAKTRRLMGLGQAFVYNQPTDMIKQPGTNHQKHQSLTSSHDTISSHREKIYRHGRASHAHVKGADAPSPADMQLPMCLYSCDKGRRKSWPSPRTRSTSAHRFNGIAAE